MFGAPEKIALFIDAGNLAYMAKAMGFQIDFKKFRSFFMTRDTRLVYAGYFTAVREMDGHRELQPLIDWLQDHGYNVIQKPTKEYARNDGSIKVKGNMDMEMAVGMIAMYEFVDRIVLVTGDGDFKPVVEYIQNRGCPITVVGGRSSRMLSSDLAKVANQVIDLADVRVREAICE